MVTSALIVVGVVADRCVFARFAKLVQSCSEPGELARVETGGGLGPLSYRLDPRLKFLALGSDVNVDDSPVPS